MVAHDNSKSDLVEWVEYNLENSPSTVRRDRYHRSDPAIRVGAPPMDQRRFSPTWRNSPAGIHRAMSVASQEIVLALFDLLAGTINWPGRTPLDLPGSSKGALGRNMLHNITVTQEAFTMG